MRALCLALCACLLGGCGLQSEGPVKKLADTVQDMNKATRWGQLGDAQNLVEPAYRMRFLQSHANWGRAIQVADSEVVGMQVAPDQESAIAMVSYDWYMVAAMTLHNTVVQQRWSNIHDRFQLVSETIIGGDQRLLAPAEAPATEAKGAEQVSVLEPGTGRAAE